jgi:hypothetical protein
LIPERPAIILVVNEAAERRTRVADSEDRMIGSRGGLPWVRNS